MSAKEGIAEASVQYVLLDLSSFTGSVAARLLGTGCDLRVWHADEALPIAYLGKACGEAPVTAAAFEAGERLANPSWLPSYGVRLAACSAAQARAYTRQRSSCSTVQAGCEPLNHSFLQHGARAFRLSAVVIVTLAWTCSV